MASDGGFAATVLRWRFVVAVGLAFLVLVFGAATVRSDDPEREFSFSGNAVIDGEPAPAGTLIEIEVEGKKIGSGYVSGSDGKWVIAVDATLLKDGICEADFYVNGTQASRQWNRCTVDIQLESNPAESTDSTDPAESDPSPDQSEPEDSDDELEELDEPEEPLDESTSDIPDVSEQTDDSTELVQPGSPSTGSGGLLPDEHDGQWTAGAFIVIGWLALTSIILLIVNRRAVRSRR